MMRMREDSMVPGWQCGLRSVLLVSFVVLLLSWLWLGSPTWGQRATPPSAQVSVTSSRVDVPSPLTLEVAEELLVQHNLAVAAARYGVDSARAQRLIASVRPNPTLTLGAEGFDLSAPGQNLASNSNSRANRTYTARIDQVFERGNKRFLRTEAAEFQVQAAEAQVLDTIRTQLLQLRQAFYSAVLARENVRVASQNLDLTNDTERLIRVRVTAGDAPEWDLIKFQASKVQFQRDLTAASLAYQQAVRDVLTLLGAPSAAVGGTTTISSAPGSALLAEAQLDVVGELRLAPVTISTSLADLRQTALAQRPDVMAAQKAVDAAQSNLELARAQRHRDLDVALEYQRNGADNTIGATVSFPLFVSHKFEGQINQGLVQVQQAN